MTSIDLGPALSLPPVKIGRVLHWGVGGFDAFIAFVLVYGWVRLTETDEWTAARLAVGGVGAVIVAALVVVFIGTTAQAVRIVVDHDGLRLISRTGATMKEVSWSGLGLPVIMEWTESTPRQVARGLPARWQLKGYRPFNTYLTQGAFEEVVRSANRVGLAVTELPCPGRPGWTRTVVGLA